MVSIRLRLAGLVLLLSGFAGTIYANPMILEGFSGVQYTNTFHAQVTYFCAPEGYGERCRTITGLTRDGKALSLKWVEGSINTNGGSGVMDYIAYQVCDCDLAPGTYKYNIRFSTAGDFGDDKTEVVTVVIKDPPPGPPQPNAEPSGSGDEDVSSPPWDIPSPPWPQGIDCKTWCEGHGQGGDDLKTVSAESADTGLATGKAVNANCTSSNRPASLPGMGALILLLGLVIYTRRNKGQDR